MDIVIIADFCSNLSKKENNNRFIYIANMLSKNNNVELITSDFDHGSKSYIVFDKNTYSFDITTLHEGEYKKNVCLKRLYSHYIWGRNVYKYLKKRKNPDAIYCAVPTLTAAFYASKYSKKNNVKFIVDIQDLWPESFKMALNIPIISDIVFSPMMFLANYAYSKADGIVAVSKTFCERALKVNKKVKDICPVFIGTNLDTYDNNCKVKCDYKKNKNDIWLAYCGSLSFSYDLISVFDALAKLKKNKNITIPKFVIMGDGPRRKEFEDYAKSYKIDVLFTGMLDYSKMCSLLDKCDIVVNPIVGSSVASIINKHADYAMSGKPVLNTQNSKEYRELIEEYNMGFNCVNGDSNDLCDKLIELINNDKLRIEMGNNARKCAEEKFDRKTSYCDIIELIENINK